MNPTYIQERIKFLEEGLSTVTMALLEAKALHGKLHRAALTDHNAIISLIDELAVMQARDSNERLDFLKERLFRRVFSMTYKQAENLYVM